MDDFKREERYYVYKISDLSDDARNALARTRGSTSNRATSTARHKTGRIWAEGTARLARGWEVPMNSIRKSPLR